MPNPKPATESATHSKYYSIGKTSPEDGMPMPCGHMKKYAIYCIPGGTECLMCQIATLQAERDRLRDEMETLIREIGIDPNEPDAIVHAIQKSEAAESQLAEARNSLRAEQARLKPLLDSLAEAPSEEEVARKVVKRLWERNVGSSMEACERVLALLKGEKE